jgi:hypothetical protein
MVYPCDIDDEIKGSAAQWGRRIGGCEDSEKLARRGWVQPCQRSHALFVVEAVFHHELEMPPVANAGRGCVSYLGRGVKCGHSRQAALVACFLGSFKAH